MLEAVGLPIVDHHCHLSPNGEGVRAARRFQAAGGSHLFLTTQGYVPDVPLRLEGYQDQFEITERLAQTIEREVGIEVLCVIAPYPVDFLTQRERLGTVAAMELQEAALDLAGRWVHDQRAIALGEVGRPHFAVSAEVMESSEALFRHALEVARDVGCPAVVHCEDLTPEGYQGVARLAAQVGFPVQRLVKHYARTIVPPDERYGVVPSFLARRDLTRISLTLPGPWFWETDFLDDPSRPGAVLDLATVPRRATQALSEDPAAAELLRVPFQESVRAVYGFTPERPDPPPP
ncbi:MAG: TatD family hydrolase [Thermoplasmata archaeon]